MLKMAAHHRKKLLGVAMSLLAGLLVVLPGLAQAEEFTQPAFQNQWNATDAAVAKGQVSRTYFWGPSPFAHTNEVYAEGPGGLRQVQYFDKARMELTQRSGTDPNFVTNGLLTVELVTGQLQVGDNQFIPRQPATNPVAGDQTNNPLTPTYASFNQGKLAFGVAGSQSATDHTGQAISEAVNKDGQVSTLAQPAANLKYAQYFGQTGHNVADVFYNFFQADPLGSDKWLNVMGYPISEPFWAKDKVIVGGQSRDVLIQLFQRRALTYTPANPAGFQVEMGNIGQHYYVWRYGFDTRDQLPGNYRVILPDGKSLYSVDLRQPTSRLKLGDTPNGQPITGVLALNEGRAVVTTANATFLVDLTKARAFKQLYVPELKKPVGGNVAAAASRDGRKLALLVEDDKLTGYTIVFYTLDTLPGDNLNVTASTPVFYDSQEAASGFLLKFSPDGRYLAFYKYLWTRGSAYEIHVMNLADKSQQVIGLGYSTMPLDENWLGQSDQLLYLAADPQNGATSVFRLDAVTGERTALISNTKIRAALPSPDGNYFALSEYSAAQGDSCDSPYGNRITIRAVANPAVSLTPAYELVTPPCSEGGPFLGRWSADGTYFVVANYEATQPGGGEHGDFSILSLLTGQPLQKIELAIGHNSSHWLTLAGPFYTLEKWRDYRGPNADSPYTITVKNLDGSQAAQINLTLPANATTQQIQAFDSAQVVQVPRP